MVVEVYLLASLTGPALLKIIFTHLVPPQIIQKPLQNMHLLYFA